MGPEQGKAASALPGLRATEAGYHSVDGPLAQYAGQVAAPLALRAGLGLGGLLAPEGPFLREVATVRGLVATLSGFVMPGLELQDGPELSNQAYEIRVLGGAVGRGQVQPGAYFHPQPGLQSAGQRHPVDGTPGLWLPEPPAREPEAHTAAALLAEHLQDRALRHAGWLLSLDELNAMLRALAPRFPEACQEPNGALPLALWRAARHLLQEGQSIRRIERLAAWTRSLLAEGCPAPELPEALRRRLVPELAYAWLTQDGVLASFPLSPRLLGALRDRVVEGPEGPELAATAAWEAKLSAHLAEAVAATGLLGGRAVLLCPEAPLRRALALSLTRSWPTWPPPAVVVEAELPRHLPCERFPELQAPPSGRNA